MNEVEFFNYCDASRKENGWMPERCVVGVLSEFECLPNHDHYSSGIIGCKHIYFAFHAALFQEEILLLSHLLFNAKTLHMLHN